jgi:hypothetical protein
MFQRFFQILNVFISVIIIYNFPFICPCILAFMRTYTYTYIYRVSQEECARLREGVPYIKVYRYNPKHRCLQLNGYGDNGQRKVWSSLGFHALYLSAGGLIGVESLSVVSYYADSAHASRNLHMYFLQGDVSFGQSYHV